MSVAAFKNACATLDLVTPGTPTCDYKPDTTDPINNFGTCVDKVVLLTVAHCADVNAAATFAAAGDDAERERLCTTAKTTGGGPPCKKSTALVGTAVACVDNGKEAAAQDAIDAGGVSSCTDLKAATCDGAVGAAPIAVIKNAAAPGAVTLGGQTAAVCVQPLDGGIACVAAPEKPMAAATCVAPAIGAVGDITAFSQQLNDICSYVANNDNAVTAPNPGAGILAKSKYPCNNNYDLKIAGTQFCEADVITKRCSGDPTVASGGVGQSLCGQDARKQLLVNYGAGWELVLGFPAPGSTANSRCQYGALQFDIGAIDTAEWSFPAGGSLSFKSQKGPGDKTGCELQ